MISTDFYRQALDILAQKRAANRSTAEKRRLEITTIFPEYEVLEKNLARTGHKLAMAILNKGKSIDEEIKLIQLENLKIQEEMARILARVGKPADYLDNIYSCKKCLDTGIFEDKRCTCIDDIAKCLAIKKLNDSSPLNLCSFESFNLDYYSTIKDPKVNLSSKDMMSRNYKICKSFAENFHIPMNNASKGILMIGNTGLGKTHLSLSIAKSIIGVGFSVVYGSAPDFFRKIEKEHFSSSDSDTIGVLNSCDLLILDDLGAEFDSQFYTSVLYNLINTRSSVGLPIIVNTNLTPKQLKERYADRIFSRLMSLEVLSFYGDDIRLKNRG